MVTVFSTKNAPDPIMILEADMRQRNRQRYLNWRCYGCGALLSTTKCDYCGKLNCYPPRTR